MKKCAYCDVKTKLTKEHIWPKCMISRMPELSFRYIGSQEKFVTSELVVSDVCSKCNNEKLSKLDSYFCSLYDKFFKNFSKEKKEFIFEYDYGLLLRSLLKITFNSSRTFDEENNFFEKLKAYILEGKNTWENIIITLDIVTPAIVNGEKIYLKSMRCCDVNVGTKNENFIIRLISVNSFYFYILISKSEILSYESVEELKDIFSRIPGSVIHPHRTRTLICDFSNKDAYDMHLDFFRNTSEAFYKLYKTAGNSLHKKLP